jgi:succinyl-diaminopimelate desuccinylase
MSAVDPVKLAQDLIRCPSVTPEDAGALDVLEGALTQLGFECHRLDFVSEAGTPPIRNLYARLGSAQPNFCFAGHTDVVPAGERNLWRADPFAAEIRDGILYGRGAADMKSAVAAFAAAAGRVLGEGKPNGSISLLITGDEEGDAINGTAKVLQWLKTRGESIDHCIVGEPTSSNRPGDTLKIGRRGSLTVAVTARGTQGHVGYPHLAKNPIPALAAFVSRLSQNKLDGGSEHFEPSTLSFTTFDTGNRAANVIPAEARAQFNIRFNDKHTSGGLIAWIERERDAIAKEYGVTILLRFTVGAQVFLTEPGAFTALVSAAVTRTTNVPPALSTTGGTSDARFIRHHCPVVEVGLAGTTMHKADECVPVADIERLSDIYAQLLRDYFANPPA